MTATPEHIHPLPVAIIVMGVSGSGKSTLGGALAARLGCAFLEGDAFHSAANVAKMRSGAALDDADRWPWLAALGAAAGAAARRDGVVVVACSSLKRSYRTCLAQAAQVPVRLVLLTAGHDELKRRLDNRLDHYMPASLLDSQVATLQPPEPDEDALVLDARLPPTELVAATARWLCAA